MRIFEDYSTIGSLNLDNVDFSSQATNDKINTKLLEDIDKAAGNSNVKVTITTAITGHNEKTSSGYISRHVNGDAVDIAIVNGKNWTSKKDAENKGIFSSIEKFVEELSDLGYVINRESGNSKSVLYFGFSDNQHENHIHISNTGDSDSGSGNSNDGDTSFDSGRIADTILKRVIGGITGVNENKKLKEEINRIKKLLK